MLEIPEEGGRAQALPALFLSRHCRIMSFIFFYNRKTSNSWIFSTYYEIYLFDVICHGAIFSKTHITIRTLVIKISPFFVMNVFHMDDQILFFRKYFTTVWTFEFLLLETVSIVGLNLVSQIHIRFVHGGDMVTKFASAVF